jgi:methionyl-tRNA synthetase
MPWFLGNSVHFNNFYWMQWGIIPIVVWSSFWKGLSLWHAAKRNETWWFIALLVINTVGILEIGYLLLVVQLFRDKKPLQKQKRK